MKERSAGQLTFGILCFVFFTVISAAVCARSDAPYARKGVLDLRSWDFKNNGFTELNGEWEFYWKTFLPPDAPPHQRPSPSALITVPGAWNSIVIDDENLPGIGYATYRLTILLPEESAESLQLGLIIRKIRSSFRLFVNGRRVVGSGVTTVGRDSAEPGHFPQVTVLPLTGERMELILHAANFYHYSGGIWNSIVIGGENEIRQTQIAHVSIEMVILGCIFVTALYHFFLWLFRPEDKLLLIFSMYCLIITLKIFTSSNTHGFDILPDAALIPAYNIGYITFFMSVPAFYYYIHLMFPTVFHRTVARIILAIGILLSICMFILPAEISTRLSAVFEIITALTGLYLLYVLIRAVHLKLENARTVAFGCAALGAAVLNDFLHGARVISTGYLLFWGIFVFILVQAWIMSRRTIKLLNTVEQQTVERGELIRELTEAHRNFTISRLGTILGLAKLAEYRDSDTGFHLERIREYSCILTRCLTDHPKYRDYINEEYINDIYHSSILHDIGKVWVKDSVLLKKGPLTEDEFAHIQQHAVKGGDIIRDIENHIGTPTYLTLGREIAYGHHEKWDGSGYPRGLRACDISLSARIVSVADVYDALTSKRPYKPPFSHAKAVSIIREGRGFHFDPDLVDVFLIINKDFEKICLKFSDGGCTAAAASE